MTIETFNQVLILMAVIAVLVFIILFFVEAGYGKMISKKWGPAINNKVAWILMEAPVFIVLLSLWYVSPKRFETMPLIFFLCFEFHYFQRSFIFPFLLKGKSKMPIVIMLMGMLFNTINGYIQGEWLFYLAPENYYDNWLTTPKFWIGLVLFFLGMAINWHSDHIIRHLRKPGDTNHYLPKGGFYNYVTSANYFGEIVEWIGFAIMTWSWAGLIFAIWTMANLVPRANSIYKKYAIEFSNEFHSRSLKRVFPFIY
ncbi:MAG: 3-oxo-5-alpha-steroid 4-dehydrogenase [Paludibacteraceae bacterium]|nr:3-oxo-5-alpha-steroid 4-dehydrogenase [Paludibacteraceae bacterium]